MSVARLREAGPALTPRHLVKAVRYPLDATIRSGALQQVFP